MCDPEIENCEMMAEPTIWDIRATRSHYLWYTIVLGVDAFLQFLFPFILWFAAV